MDKKEPTIKEFLILLLALLAVAGIGAYLEMKLGNPTQGQDFGDSGVPIEWVLNFPPNNQKPEFISGSQNSTDGIFIRHLKFRTAEPITIRRANFELYEYFTSSGWVDKTPLPETLELLEFNNKERRELLRINLLQEADKVVVEFTIFQNVQ